jgi:hypothetical protein
MELNVPLSIRDSLQYLTLCSSFLRDHRVRPPASGNWLALLPEFDNRCGGATWTAPSQTTIATSSIFPLPITPTGLRFQDNISFTTFDMGSQLQSSRFQGLFESALQDYESQTGMTLAKHPIAEQLQSCDSVDSVLAVLEQQARAFTEFRRSDGRVMKSLRSTVSVLHALSSTTILGEIISAVRHSVLTVLNLIILVLQPFPPAQAMFSGFAVLLAVCVFLRSRHVSL